MLVAGVAGAAASETVEEFKRRTLDKLHDVRCPDHKQAPRLNFRGATLRDVSIQMSACCEKLADLANFEIQLVGNRRSLFNHPFIAILS